MTERRSAIPAFLLIGIAVLIIMNIASNRRINNLERQLNNLHSSIHMQLGDVRHTNSIMWDISNRLSEVSEQVTQGTRLSFGETVLIQNHHAATASAEVEVAFSLRTHTPGDAVTVTARGQDGRTHSAVASPLDAGRFAASMDLPLHDNYVFTFTTAGETVTTGELTQFNLADRLAGRFSYWLGHGFHTVRNQPTVANLHPQFRNDTAGNPALNITSLTLYIETDDGEVVTVWDLTGYLHATLDGQALHREWDRRLEVAIEDPINPDEFTFARLVMYDNLGIRYEQLDSVFFPGQFSHGHGGSGATPIPARAWAVDDMGFGRMRIVE